MGPRPRQVFGLVCGLILVAAIGPVAGCQGRRDTGDRRPGDAATPDQARRVRADAYIDEGGRLYARKEYRAAIETFDEAVRLDPTNAAAYYNRGLAWKALHEYGRAVEDFDEAIRLDPGYAPAWNNRGLAWYHQHDYDRALADFDRAIQLDPRPSGPYSNRAVTRLERKEYDRALQDLDEAIRRDPHYAKAYCNRGLVYKALKDNAKAVADFTAAIGCDRRYLRAYVERGMISEARKDYAAATADYRQALDVYADDVSAAYQLAGLLATCPNARYRDGPKALELATRACERTGWHNPDCLAVLAAACAERGDYAQARKWQRKALAFPEYGHDEGRRRLRRYENNLPWRTP